MDSFCEDGGEDFEVCVGEGDGSEIGYDGAVLVLFWDEDSVCFVPSGGADLSLCYEVEDFGQDWNKDEFEVLVEGICEAIGAWC